MCFLRRKPDWLLGEIPHMQKKNLHAKRPKAWIQTQKENVWPLVSNLQLKHNWIMWKENDLKPPLRKLSEMLWHDCELVVHAQKPPSVKTINQRRVGKKSSTSIENTDSFFFSNA